MMTIFYSNVFLSSEKKEKKISREISHKKFVIRVKFFCEFSGAKIKIQ